MKVWKKLSIKNKILVYAGTVLLFFTVVVLFDVWIVKYFMVDFNRILENNVVSGEMITALEAEVTSFENFSRLDTEENASDLQSRIAETKEKVYACDLDYAALGERRFAQLQAIRNSYEIYTGARDAVMQGEYQGDAYIRELYRVYGMQTYLQQYMQRFLSATIEEGNLRYQELLPSVSGIIMLAVILSILLAFTMFEIAKMLNHSMMDPIIKLVTASKQIAANEFFVEDVETDNEDELGELVHAFNKMKYATGEYIKALEEKREVLDRLHQQELENLETEKQLETMNLEVLKNQIQPHFLFNTLNVIAGMADLEDAVTTEKMINALSSLFRYNLKTQQAEVLLNQEIKVAKDYMYLQQMRFGSRVSFTLECMEDVEHVLMPTFTIQPLLENAIIHGLGPKEEGGSIKMQVFRKEDMLHIRVEDSGIGMTQMEVILIRWNLANGTNEGVGIGISNIYARIHSMYGKCNFYIESEKGKGTAVEVVIPFHKDKAPMER